MKIQIHRKHGLTLLGAIIIFAVVIALGAIMIKILLKVMERMPPPQSPRDTNIVSVVSFELFQDIQPVSIAMPTFSFAEQEVQALDADAFLSHGEVVIERSTNLVDWTPAGRMGVLGVFNLARDTNPPSPACFYLAVLIP